jgi:hypothetical protein
MRFNTLLSFLIAGSACLFGQAAPPAVAPLTPTAPLVGTANMTNDSILQLLKAGISEDVIAGMMTTQPGKYSVTPDSVITLKRAGVSDKIIAAMLSHISAPSEVQAPSIEPIVLHDATPVRLRLGRNLSSADASTGETVDFEVLDDVKVDDQVVIAHSAKAIGTITNAEHKKHMGRGGKLDLTIDSVRLVNDEKVALRGVKETKGGGHTGAMAGAMVATAIVVWPAAPLFLFMHGKDTTIPKGTEITAYTDGEVKLDRRKISAKQPLTN